MRIIEHSGPVRFIRFRPFSDVLIRSLPSVPSRSGSSTLHPTQASRAVVRHSEASGNDPRKAREGGTEKKSKKGSESSANAVLQGVTHAKLNGVLQRIDALIGGYTGGASSHPKFLKNFDQEHAEGRATLSTGGGAGSQGGVLFSPLKNPPALEGAAR